MTLEILAAALGLFAAMRKNKKVSGVGRVDQYNDIPQYIAEQFELDAISPSELGSALYMMNKYRSPLKVTSPKIADHILYALQDYEMENDDFVLDDYLSLNDMDDIFLSVYDYVVRNNVLAMDGVKNITFYNSALARENDGNGDDEFTPMRLSDVKDSYFKLKATDSAPVWVKGDYDRSLRAYECHTFDGNRERYITGKTIVYAGFWF